MKSDVLMHSCPLCQAIMHTMPAASSCQVALTLLVCNNQIGGMVHSMEELLSANKAHELSCVIKYNNLARMRRLERCAFLKGSVSRCLSQLDT